MEARSEADNAISINWGGDTTAPSSFSLADLSGRVDSGVLGESTVLSGNGATAGTGTDSGAG